MDREKLEAPFPKELVKTRKGAFGQKLSYVEGIEYVKRLNDAFDACWSFEVVSHQVLDHEVVVLGQLTAGDVTKQAFGGSHVTRTKEANEIVSIADDLKAAATDSLKKCCSLFGIGLHLYTDENGRAASRSTPNNHQAGTQTNGRNGRANGNDRLSQRQLSAIWSLARKAGYSSDEVRQRCIESFGVPPEQLNKTDASSLIGDLSDELGDSAYNGSKS